MSEREMDQERDEQMLRAEQDAALEALPAGPKEPKTFPIIRSYEKNVKPHPMRIPWSLAEKAYSAYAAQHGTSQSLERMAERGGFHPDEMDEFVPNWREECSEIEALRTQLAAALRAREEAERARDEERARANNNALAAVNACEQIKARAEAAERQIAKVRARLEEDIAAAERDLAGDWLTDDGRLSRRVKIIDLRDLLALLDPPAQAAGADQ